MSNLRRLNDAQSKIVAAQHYLTGLEGAQLRGFGLAQGLKMKPKQPSMSGLGYSLDIGGYDLLDTDTYTDAWDGAGDAIGGAWDWLEDLLEYAGEQIVKVWDRLASVISAIKEGFTSMLDIAYVTADGIAEMWALYKWVGGRDEYIELQQARDNWLLKKKKNTKKYGPYYMKATDGSTKPADFPGGATNINLFSKENAARLNPEDPDFKGTHNLLGVAQDTWKYYLPGHDGIVPDWKNPLDYPNAVLYWYYDAQLNKIEAISANFNFSKMGQTRNWLFERGLLIQAWMSGGWNELYNLKNIIDQNYKVARARVDLIGHETTALVPGIQSLLDDGDVTPEQEEISILGIKSAKQLGIEKGEKLRQMFPYNAEGYMGPQMWYLLHDFRHKMKEKNATPYPLICLEDKISDQGYSVIKGYLAQLRDEKIEKAQLLLEEGRNNPGTQTGTNFEQTAILESQKARTAYDNVVADIDNMPLIFVEGMMSAFGGRAGPYYILDADNQFGDYPWVNRDAFAVGSKPDRPASVLPGFDSRGLATLEDEWGMAVSKILGNPIPNSTKWQEGGLYNKGQYGTANYGKVFPNGLPFTDETLTRRTGRIGSSPTLTLDWFSAQADWNTRGWGWGTQIFNPAKMDDISDWFGTEKIPTVEHTNLGKMFDWHPFDALWCHDGQTHMGGQYAVSHNAIKQSVDTKDWGIAQNDLHGVYMSDWWNWNDSLLIEPLALHGYGWRDITEGSESHGPYGGHKTIGMGATNFMLRKNTRIGSMADQGKHLFSLNWDSAAAMQVPNVKQSTSQYGDYGGTVEGGIITMPLSGGWYDRKRVTTEFNPIIQSSGHTDMSGISTGVRGSAGVDDTYGLWNLNASPVQSIFAAGILRNKGQYESHSLWKATIGKRFAAGPTIGHGGVKESRRDTTIDGRRITSNHLVIEGLTNYHTMSQRAFHPIAAVQQTQPRGLDWGWPCAENRGSQNYAPRGIMKQISTNPPQTNSNFGWNHTTYIEQTMISLLMTNTQKPQHSKSSSPLLAAQLTHWHPLPDHYGWSSPQGEMAKSPLWYAIPILQRSAGPNTNTIGAGVATNVDLVNAFGAMAYSHYYDLNPNFQKTLDYTSYGPSVIYPSLGHANRLYGGLLEPNSIRSGAGSSRYTDGTDGSVFMSYKVTPPLESTAFVGLSPRPGSLQVNNAGTSPYAMTARFGGGRIPGGNHPSTDPYYDKRATDQPDAGYASLDWSSPWAADVWTSNLDDGEKYQLVHSGKNKDFTSATWKNDLPLLTVPLLKSNNVGTWSSVLSLFAEGDLNINDPNWHPKDMVWVDEGKFGSGTTNVARQHGWPGVNFADITSKSGTAANAFIQSAAFSGDYTAYAEPTLASANFNIAPVASQDTYEIAAALRMTWSANPNSHLQLAKVIKHLLHPGNKTCAGINLDGVESPIYHGGKASADSIIPETGVWQGSSSTEEMPTTYDGTWKTNLNGEPGRNMFGITDTIGPYGELPLPSAEEIQGWTVPQIITALFKPSWCPNLFGTGRLIESVFLAEPDNNPMGMWFDSKDPSNAFFGITDMNKLLENSEVMYKKEDNTDSTLKLMNLGEFWNLHRGLKNKDRNKYGDDLVDWFNSKVTKYGWCHIMQGTKPVRLDKFKEAPALPRYWAPLFVPYRSINDMAPRLYFGHKTVKKKMGGGIQAGLQLSRMAKGGEIDETAIAQLGFRKMVGAPISGGSRRFAIPGANEVDKTGVELAPGYFSGTAAYVVRRPWTATDSSTGITYTVWPAIVKTTDGKWTIYSPWTESHAGVTTTGTTNWGSNIQSSYGGHFPHGLAPTSVETTGVGGTKHAKFRTASAKLFKALHIHLDNGWFSSGLHPDTGYPRQDWDKYKTADSAGADSYTSAKLEQEMAPWVRHEFYAAAPYADLNDDNRLLGPFAIQGNANSPADTAEVGKSRVNLTDTHWAAQFSWLNCGWFGFNTVEEAELFLANQFKSTSVSDPESGATFDWKGMLNGPPTGTIGFGPIDDLIDFIRNWDTMIMEKIDLERMYQGVLNKYTAAKMQFDKIAEFDLKTTIEGITDMDILSGYAKVMPTSNNTPKTYRWLPVFGKISDNSVHTNRQYGQIELHPENAPIIQEYIDASNGFSEVLGSDGGLIEYNDTTKSKYWPAAENSPSKFVAGVYIEQQNQNKLGEDENWVVVEFVPVQGIEHNNTTGAGPNSDLSKSLAAAGYPDSSDESFIPWVVDGQIVKTEVEITGGIFQSWSDVFSSPNSPLGRFMSKIRTFENGIRAIWSDKIPGFNVSMKNFWSGLGEENNVLAQFLRDVVELTGNFRKDYTGIATSAMNVNDKIETYLDRFEQMSVNWSNSIHAMNKYADYMATTLYSMNQKFDYALDSFRNPYQQFQDVITSEASPVDFNKVVSQLDKMFSKGEKMNQTFGKKLDFNQFKGQGSSTKLAGKSAISAINLSGLANIDMNQTDGMGQNEIVVSPKPWLEVGPPPSITLDFEAPPIRPWTDEPTNEVIEPNWGEQEFFEGDLPSETDDTVIPIIDPRLRTPGIPRYYGNRHDPRMRDRIEALYKGGYVAPSWSNRTGGSVVGTRRGQLPYSTYPAGTSRKVMGIGPNGEAQTTWYGDTIPENPEIGDRWLDGYSGNLFEWTGEQWIMAEQQMIPIKQPDGGAYTGGMDDWGKIDDIDLVTRPGLDLPGQVSQDFYTSQQGSSNNDEESASTETPNDTDTGNDDSGDDLNINIQNPGGGTPGGQKLPFFGLNGPLPYGQQHSYKTNRTKK